MTFEEFFFQATETEPFPYQVRMATESQLPQLLQAPTGAGKTAASILSWVWRRRYAESEVRRETPRRLVYCLPTRVLVEQTRTNAARWLERLGIGPGDWSLPFQERSVAVAVLMGGEEPVDWDLLPEQDAVIIGTQDMLLSRALNRGYGMSRYRWPMHFALLNNDCLWVYDEVQLMGPGLATSAQLAAFRASFGGFGPGQGLWMSATIKKDWLATHDFLSAVSGLSECALSEADLESPVLAARLNARKTVIAAPAGVGEVRALAEAILAQHRPSSLTLVVVNTVERALTLHDALQRCLGGLAPGGRDGAAQGTRGHKHAPPPGSSTDPELLLIHSRFRPAEREDIVARLTSPVPASGRVVVSTQVVEAGVDISAATLFTELAPWPSLVQRFGRCNRYGEYAEARIFWIDLATGGRKSQAPPYSDAALDGARAALSGLEDAGPSSLERHVTGLGAAGERLFHYETEHLLRRRDFVELFDTSPDLAGNDLDISRFIRDGTESDVQVFWRQLPEGQIPDPRSQDGEAPVREELCQIPVGELREFLQEARSAFAWDFLSARWLRVSNRQIAPGHVYLLPGDGGGYLPARGWSRKSRAPVAPCARRLRGRFAPDANDGDRLGVEWQTLGSHTDEVVTELELLLRNLEPVPDHVPLETLRLAARWHDRGKAHPVFQGAFADRPSAEEMWAKAPKLAFRGYHREGNPAVAARGFRHELAGALAAVQAGLPDLVSYLIGAHHGKVRLTIRSLPHETRPLEPKVRFARGIWEGDELPGTNLGGGSMAPAATLSLQPTELCLSRTGEPSWAERMLGLRDDSALGPCRLAFLEMLLRVADMRASVAAEARELSSEKACRNRLGSSGAKDGVQNA